LISYTYSTFAIFDILLYVIGALYLLYNPIFDILYLFYISYLFYIILHSLSLLHISYSNMVLYTHFYYRYSYSFYLTYFFINALLYMRIPQ